MSHRNDPREITAKFDCKCKSCAKKIARGTSIFYFPLTKAVLCSICGAKDFKESMDSSQDEDFFNANSTGYGY